MVTICTTSLTFSNSTFCPHTVFMCFVWISEQTAIISLYSINWLVFITDLTLYSPVVTIHTTRFNVSTFCPHNVFMCSVWISVPTSAVSERDRGSSTMTMPWPTSGRCAMPTEMNLGTAFISLHSLYLFEFIIFIWDIPVVFNNQQNIHNCTFKHNFLFSHYN